MANHHRASESRGRCLVTGVAGFIGSHLAERLLRAGYAVLGVDRFADYYPRQAKESNLASVAGAAGFEMVEADLAAPGIDPLLSEVDYVFHQAGQPGIRASWGEGFALYLRDNVLATQNLLEAARRQARLKRFVFASSSSVYGDSKELPLRESALPRPVSPYGVTKLSAEHLCHLYATNYSVPTVSLRYFTVYGPRQRPDMAFSRFLRALFEDRELTLNGDGGQTRDFTFVSDIVDANLSAMTADVVGQTFNIGGGCRTSIIEVVSMLERLAGRRVGVHLAAHQAGDTLHTLADCSAARACLGFKPRVTLEEGLLAQIEWTRRAAGSLTLR